MSTPVMNIITGALRETNLIPLGVAPTQDQANEAFTLLDTIVRSVLGNEMGENMNPLALGADNIHSPKGYPWWQNDLHRFVETNTRVMCNLTGEAHFNLHPKPHDGARMGIVDVAGNFSTNPLTIRGNGRNIEGFPELTFDTDGETREWIYREDLGDWVVVVPISITGNMPWPPQFDDMFIIMLAFRLNPRYGQVIHPASEAALKTYLTKFISRYSQTTTQVQVENALLYLTHWNRYWGYESYGRSSQDSDQLFNTGFPF